MRSPGRTSPLPIDAMLVAQLRDKDEAAFEAILDAWSVGMLRLARSIVSTPESAAEVVQDTWLAVISSLHAFEGRSSLRTWVNRILINAAKRRALREGRSVPFSSMLSGKYGGPTVDPDRFRGPDEPLPGHWRDFPAPWPSPERQVLTDEVQAEVASAVAELPEQQRIAITLRDIEGCTSDEVCTSLEISAGNQRVLLHRARAYVRGRLEEYFDAAGSASGRSTRR